jgi:peptidoglycan/xylan/chitin deacetylase (PgdA/CDA1 family)
MNMIFSYLLLFSSLIVLSLVSVLFFQPRCLLAIATLIVPEVVYFAKTNKLVIALTIDDGPDARTTPKILEILRRYGAKATFFVISNRIKGNERLIADMISCKHELGNHLTEDKPSIQLSPQEFEEDLLKAHNVISTFGNLRWLRPASGWHNTTMTKIAQKYGYQVALGSVFPFDTHIPSSWFASKHILSNVSPGSIIVLHDNALCGERTASTLEKILPELSRRGYQVVTLSELFAS